MKNRKIVRLESELAGLEEAYTDLKEEYGKDMILEKILLKRKALKRKIINLKRK